MIRRLLTIASALLLGTAALGIPVVSVQDDQLTVAPAPTLERRLDLIASTGTRVTRVDILWRDIAPRRPMSPRNPEDLEYRWGRLDAVMRGLTRRGVDTVVGDIFLTPTWASASGAQNAAPVPSDLADFAGALAMRYRGTWPDPLGGTLPELRIIEPWNEPNIGRYLAPQCRLVAGRLRPSSPALYAELLLQAGAAIRVANPHAIIVAGAAGPQGGRRTTCRSADDSQGVQLLIDAIRLRRVPFDAWSQHIYPIGSPDTAPFFPSWNTLGTIQRELARVRPGIPILIDETGYHTSYNRSHRYFVSERQQADWVRTTWRAAARHPQVKLVTWFNLQDNPDWTGGLLRGDGSAKPSLAAFQRLAANSPRLEVFGP